MSRKSRWFQVSVLIVVTALAWCQPQTASAWFGRWHRGFCGVGFRPWCGPVFGPRFYGGWGGWYGGTRFAYSDSVYLGGPFGGFFSGGVSSYVIGPTWCGPTYFGPWGGYGWGGCYPYGYGGWGYSPIVVSPFGGSIAPVYGPAGILPFMGLSATATTVPVQSLAARNPAMTPMARLATRTSASGMPAPPPAPQLALGRGRLETVAAGRGTQVAPSLMVRASNGVARLRAAKLVAIGDRHLRMAVQAPAKLSAALDAYRRAATIAPDQPDTYLRQAIVLTALERGDDAAKAVERAVAIDARLGEHVPAALVAQETLRLPPDPVFGDRPDSGPTTLVSRSTGLLSRIFGEDAATDAPAMPAGANWIATLWSQQWEGQVNAVAAR